MRSSPLIMSKFCCFDENGGIHHNMICSGISSAVTSTAGLPWMMYAFSHWALVM